jgi:hypothetical protein
LRLVNRRPAKCATPDGFLCSAVLMNAFLQIKHYVVVIGLQQPNPVETTNLNVMQIYPS